jgi:hypothetical protein
VFINITHDNGDVETREVIQFTASTDGWLDSAISPIIILTGETFDLVAITTVPDPAPVTHSGNWDYDTPTTTGTPGTGVITHSNRSTDLLQVNKIDNDGTDQGDWLVNLTPGDKIRGVGYQWTIQMVTDNGTWVEFVVSPASQGSPDGVATFEFDTVVAVPITFGREDDYWLNNPLPVSTAQGLYGVDVSMSEVVADDNAYGLDILVQDAYVPAEWKVKLMAGDSVGINNIGTAQIYNQAHIIKQLQADLKRCMALLGI